MPRNIYYYCFLFFIIFAYNANAQTKYTVSGFVREAGSLEQLIGVNIYKPNTSIGISTNTYGFYSLSLPASTDSITLVYSFTGYERQIRKLLVSNNIELNIELKSNNTLNEVIVTGKKQDERVSESVQMSTIDIPISQIKKIPSFLGEKDVLRVLQLMPGVQKGGEGQTGIYVRGGGPDQNLIILDDATVYNANHLFGFFSVFNGDAIKSVELTKGGFPAQFGGRLSSVIEVNMKDGNKEKLHGEGGIGLISSRLTLEGPLFKNKKSSFIVSGRRTYLDILVKPIIAASQAGEEEKGTGGYYFYDLTAKGNYDFGQKNKLYISGYFGQDKFYGSFKTLTTKSENGIKWGNATATIRWNHLFSDKMFSNTSLIFSRYNFNIFSLNEQTNNNKTDKFQLNYDSGIRDFSIKSDFDFFPNNQHSIKFGLQSIAHRFTPSAVVLQNDNIGKFEKKIENIDVIESGIYIQDIWQPFEVLKVNAGIRLSSFIAKNKSYLRPEPRVSAAFKIKKDLSFKASYAQMNQYIHMLSNTGLGLPTDLWVPTTDKIAPQQSEQFAAGFAKDFDEKGLTLTIEGYYKNMRDIVNYKEGASFLLFDDPTGAEKIRWEDNITRGQAKSYGLEFLLQKKVGRFSGWLGYTLSKTTWQFPDLNFGKTFFPRYDRRHDISLVSIYELSPRITLSGTWVYGTGNALTIPVAKYSPYQLSFLNANQYNGINNLSWYGYAVNEYGEKNGFRAEAYHRLDFGIQMHKKVKSHERTWEISLYNAYNRRNPFFYEIGSNVNTRQPELQRYSVFPIVPSFSYNFKF